MADGSSDITPQAGDDLRSALASAIATSEAKTDEPTKPEKESKQPVAVEDAKPEEGEDKPEADGGSATPAEKASDAKPDEKDGDAKPEQKSGVEPPAHWPAKDKEVFAKQPKDVQDIWLRRDAEREADYTKKTQGVAELRREFEPVQKLFEPHRDIMRQKGYTPETLITGWYNVEKALMQGGPSALNVLKGIVSGYKIDPAQLAAQLGLVVSRGAAPAPDTAKPDGQQPPAQLHDPRVDSVVNWIQTQEQQRQTAEAQRVMNDIQAFSNATDPSGKRLHPYFDEVEADMVALSQAYGLKDLNELYERAVRSNTSTYQKLQADQTAALEAQRKAETEKKGKEDRAKAEAARKASKSVIGAPGAGQPSLRRNADRSLRDELLDAAEEVGTAA